MDGTFDTDAAPVFIRTLLPHRYCSMVRSAPPDESCGHLQTGYRADVGLGCSAACSRSGVGPTVHYDKTADVT